MYTTRRVDLTSTKEHEPLLRSVAQLEIARSGPAGRQIRVQVFVEFCFAEVIPLVDNIHVWQHDSHVLPRSLLTVAMFCLRLHIAVSGGQFLCQRSRPLDAIQSCK